MGEHGGKALYLVPPARRAYRMWFFKDGKEVDRRVGVMPPSAFTQVLDSL